MLPEMSTTLMGVFLLDWVGEWRILSACLVSVFLLAFNMVGGGVHHSM